MKIQSIIILFFLFMNSFFMTSCESNHNEEGHDHSEEKNEGDHDKEESNVAEISAQQMKTAQIEVGNFQDLSLNNSLKINGFLRVPNEKRATINSIYSGTITKLYIKKGDYIRKGQTVAIISNPDFLAVQEDYTNLLSQMTFAKQEAERQKILYEGNAGALKNLQSAQAQLKSFNARKRALEQQIKLMGVNPSSVANGKLQNTLVVNSPISGYVTEMFAVIGAYVDPTIQIAEVADNNNLHVDLQVYEADLATLSKGQIFDFSLPNNPGRMYQGKVEFIGTSFEPNTKNVLAHAEVLGDKTGLIDGMNVVAYVNTGKVDGISLPNDAIVNEEGKDYIFVDRGKNKEGMFLFEKVQVQKGITDLGNTQIIFITPISKTEKVVTKNAFFVNAVLSGSGGHNH